MEREKKREIGGKIEKLVPVLKSETRNVVPSYFVHCF